MVRRKAMDASVLLSEADESLRTSINSGDIDESVAWSLQSIAASLLVLARSRRVE